LANHVFAQQVGSTGGLPFKSQPGYTTYKSPYGPKYVLADSDNMIGSNLRDCEADWKQIHRATEPSRLDAQERYETVGAVLLRYNHPSGHDERWITDFEGLSRDGVTV
jgi:hypothetical protein